MSSVSRSMHHIVIHILIQRHDSHSARDVDASKTTQLSNSAVLIALLCVVRYVNGSSASILCYQTTTIYFIEHPVPNKYKPIVF